MFLRYRWIEWDSYHVLCFLILLSQRYRRHEISGDRFRQNWASCFSSFIPFSIRFCGDGFRTISSRIQAPRMTNDRDEICEHNSQQWRELFFAFPSSHHTLSLYINMKMTLSLTWSGSHCGSSINFLRCCVHQPAKVCILQLHLRTRRCVGFRISSHPALWFYWGCEFPWTFGCNQTYRGWAPCRNMWRQVHRCRFDFATTLSSPCHSCILFAIVLEQLSAASRAEMADDKQMKKIFPLITHEIPFGQDVCELVFGGQCNGFRFLGPNWFCQTTNQEQLCGSVKHVSLWDFGLLLSSLSSLHCPQRHTT